MSPRDRRVRLKRVSLAPARGVTQGESEGLIYNYMLETSVPKIEDFEPKSKYRYLASTTGSSTLISITYIVFLTKLQKR